MGDPLKRRGFILVMCLLLCIFLFLVGLGFLGLKSDQYRSVGQAQLSIQAQALAEAGVEDFRLKLDRDPQFPPQTAENGLYTYRENLVAGGQNRGTYTVSVDSTYASYPYFLLLVTCTGEVGSSAQGAVARRAYRCEVDVAPFTRSAQTVPNPDFRRVLNVQDLGGS